MLNATHFVWEQEKVAYFHEAKKKIKEESQNQTQNKKFHCKLQTFNAANHQWISEKNE